MAPRLTLEQLKRLNPGDRIRFRAVTRWSDAPVWRTVSGMIAGQPTVRFGGWSDFIVRNDEIIQIDHKQPDPTP